MKQLGYIINTGLEPEIITEKKLTDKEYEDVFNLMVNAEKIILLYKEILPVINGYEDIEKGLQEYHVGINRDERNLKTLVQNYLSSIRAYVDTMEHTLNEYYGKDNNYLLKFRELKSQGYDLNFSYRLVEALRNFSQHRSVPIDAVFMSVENEMEVIKLIINKETILKDKKFKRKIKDEVEENCDEQINVLNHFDNMKRCLNFITGKIIIEIMFDNIDVFKKFFLYEELIKEEGHSLILIEFKKIEEDFNKLNLNIKTFLFDNVRQVINHYYPWDEYMKLQEY